MADQLKCQKVLRLVNETAADKTSLLVDIVRHGKTIPVDFQTNSLEDINDMILECDIDIKTYLKLIEGVNSRIAEVNNRIAEVERNINDIAERRTAERRPAERRLDEDTLPLSK